jgi:hypothetical protein
MQKPWPKRSTAHFGGVMILMRHDAMIGVFCDGDEPLQRWTIHERGCTNIDPVSKSTILSLKLGLGRAIKLAAARLHYYQFQILSIHTAEACN